ncbi:uncharacterized protein LOC114361497 [Ostrinia furnacalis]|uniref:uncharacterized protein LOC114361497 n=1 Tax=Ostrinia furnacalis TaxID=93504 RepID=UPI00103F19CE|nr:uncharacterized protein LOC114361497 [Ostrinia furnacalis]
MDDDPHDPGGTAPPVSNYVTISRNSSCLDTEGSVTDNNNCESNVSHAKRKRTLSRKVCKHCNKKRRSRHNKSNVFDSTNVFECQCILSSSTNELQDAPIVSSLDPSPSTANLSANENLTNSPSAPVARPSYVASDLAPYVVHIQRVPSDPNENCTIHPISFGFFLKKNGIRNIIDGSLKRIGRNRLSISFSKFEDANSFLDNGSLKFNKYKAFIPSFNVTRMGVVRGVPTDWTEEEIVSNISVPIGCGKILKARRLKRKNIVNGEAQFVPIETVVLTFDGQVLPKRVFLCFNSLPVDLYIYPTIQCFSCCRYGHVKSQCRSTPRCFKCGLGHSGHTCSVEEDEIRCCLCSGLHMATSKVCPEYNRQKNIKESMAKDCITYAEALKLHPPCSKSYADVLVSPTPQNSYNHVSSNYSNKTSYKKTVFLKPRSPPRFSKGYDKSAHDEIIQGYNSEISPSKSILINSDEKYSNSLSNLSLKELIVALINSLQTNLSSLPSNAASIKDRLLDKISHNEQSFSNSMELPQHFN